MSLYIRDAYHILITIGGHIQQPHRSKFVQSKKKRSPLKELKLNLYKTMVIVLSRPYACGLHAPIFISRYSLLIISNKCVLMQETHIMPIITGSYSHTVTARAKQENHLALWDAVNKISLPRKYSHYIDSVLHIYPQRTSKAPTLATAIGHT